VTTVTTVHLPTEFRLPLKRVPGKKPDIAELRRLFFTNYLSPFLRRYIPHPMTPYTNALGTLEHFIEKDLANARDDDAIVYAFGPTRLTLDLSRVAAHHWLDVALPGLYSHHKYLDGWFSAFGYAPATPSAPLAEVLARPVPFPILDVSFPAPKKTMVAAVRGAPDLLVYDEALRVVRIGDLNDADRARVTAAAETGQCECILCEKLRTKTARKPSAKASAKPKAKAKAKRVTRR
jgi:hypothetical protein